MPRPGRFISGEENWYPWYRKVGGTPGLFGRMRKISPPPEGFDPRMVHTVASSYTERPTYNNNNNNNNNNYRKQPCWVLRAYFEKY